jgi:glycosyltransferase involved in cell wall biosynthesis
MIRVTVGVPVYNADTLLERALANLCEQTYPHFKVVILDNASTDGTAAIAQKFVAKDQRFSYHRQPYNKGCRQNFVDVLAMADTPYFVWRAYDDFTDPNYLEETVRLLDASPQAAMAVGRVVMAKREGDVIKTFPQQGSFEPASIYAARLVARGRPSWIYGLFRTDDLKRSLRHVTENYAHVYGFDPLTILPFLVTRRIVGSDKTSFIQGFVDRDDGEQENGVLDPRMMQSLRNDFRRYCKAALPRLVGPGDVGGLIRPALWLYADKSYRWVKILNARLRILFGEKPHAATTKYD